MAASFTTAPPPPSSEKQPKCKSYLRFPSSRKKLPTAFPHTFNGYTPRQLLLAAGWDGKPIKAAPITFGFISLGGVVNDSDVAAAAAAFGQPVPNIIRVGTPQANDPGGANVENNLDLFAVWVYQAATGNRATVVIAFENNDDNGIPQGFNDLTTNKVQVASLSWGQAESQFGAQAMQNTRVSVQKFVASGGKIFVASGDNSTFDSTGKATPDCPCNIPECVAVGGVTLTQVSNGWARAAWGDGNPQDEGGGGGVSNVFLMPSYQAGIVPGAWRTCVDMAESADPEYGFPVYSDGQLAMVGGTSGAAPTAAGFWGIAYGAALLTGLTPPSEDPHIMMYDQASTLMFDVTTGSDGSPAKTGYDIPTGNGSTNIMALVGEMNGTTLTPAPNPPPAPPAPVPPPVTPPVTPVPPVNPTPIPPAPPVNPPPAPSPLPPIPPGQPPFLTLSQVEKLLHAGIVEVESVFPRLTPQLQFAEAIADGILKQLWPKTQPSTTP